MKVSKKRVLAAVAALMALAMIATGCSSGSKSGGSTEVTEIKIGIGAPLTAGAVALGKGMERGAELAIEKANESEEAKAAGVKFVGVPGDDQGDPKTGVTVANTFVSDPNLLGVMGHLNSGVTIPASKVYADKKVVMVSPAATNPALTQQGLTSVFRVCTTDAVHAVRRVADPRASLGRTRRAARLSQVRPDEGAGEYKKYKRPFLTVWRVGGGRASAGLGTDRVFAGGISA